MTDRKAFEEWSNTVDIKMLSPASNAFAWAAWQAAKATAPAPQHTEAEVQELSLCVERVFLRDCSHAYFVELARRILGVPAP